MKVGYARVSTEEQEAGFEAQQHELEALGCHKVFAERLSAVAIERPQLDALIEFVREGDEVVVTRLDRLARSMRDMLDIVGRIRAKRASIVLPGIGTINGDEATSELLLNILAAVAQFEREIMLSRQRAGIAKAKSEGKYRGRQPTAQRLADQVRALAAEGWQRAEIARQLSCNQKHKHGPKCQRISERSVYRILARHSESLSCGA
jgi:DNA invertase Pin-like site-specific DNA recombinase